MNRHDLSAGDVAKIGAGALGALIVYGLAAEAVESAREFGQLAISPVFFGVGVPRGDGHPVMAIPGWLASDGYLQPLLGWLERVGYAPVASGIKRNTGRLGPLVSEIASRVDTVVRQSGRPATLIGHSLGGVIARAIARRQPQMVRQVITMGSPLHLDAAPIGAPIPLTAIYARGDRIVRYPRALAPDGSLRDGKYVDAESNIEVSGCHCGMAFNPRVYQVLGRLLPENPMMH
jgi:pimeloyl-ACP methyl ester carboxylesterase